MQSNECEADRRALYTQYCAGRFCHPTHPASAERARRGAVGGQVQWGDVVLSVGKRIRIVGRGTSMVGYEATLVRRHDDGRWFVRFDDDPRDIPFPVYHLEALPEPEPHMVAGE